MLTYIQRMITMAAGASLLLMTAACGIHSTPAQLFHASYALAIPDEFPKDARRVTSIRLDLTKDGDYYLQVSTEHGLRRSVLSSTGQYEHTHGQVWTFTSSTQTRSVTMHTSPDGSTLSCDAFPVPLSRLVWPTGTEDTAGQQENQQLQVFLATLETQLGSPLEFQQTPGRDPAIGDMD